MSVSIYTFKTPWKFSTAKIFLPRGAVIMIAFDGLTIKERFRLIKILLTKKSRGLKDDRTTNKILSK